MTSLRQLVCARPGCPHRYDQHAPGGAGCMVWDPADDDHCGCRGFQWVPLTSAAAPRGPSRR